MVAYKKSLSLATLATLMLMVQISLARPSEGDEVPMLGAEEENCIPLRWCDPLMYLVNSIRDNNIPAGYTRAQIVQQLRATTCRVEDDQVIVNCPIVESETDELGVRGGIIVGRDGDSAAECEGSLKIHLLHPERGVVVRTVRGRRNNLANIPGYSVDTVFRVQVDGNCCWHAFPNSFRRGSPQHLAIGFDDNPSPFRSVQKTECL